MFAMTASYDNTSKIDLIIGQDDVFYVLSDTFFDSRVEWLEYYAESRRLEFILEEGEIRNFSIPVEEGLATRLEHQTAAILLKGTMDKIEEHGGYTLIVHR